ncbi:anchored repeat ABC transporter, substrate-binding protein [Nocardioides carbamazepini]|uniref:anchored repeat ABC transporter, substrate-binding protein n=1 Tax=Nocardioides carbamazepini TaxID=2854259 RepID=UPI00214A0E05|nr:anchored repeat ABC transporter, substrate-binding protein [Nocardioides carbamazepini]MCR1783472.1 anchored repeat ABC transporter, substrate-binding protein [Nocardioides carbamazepini]
MRRRVAGGAALVVLLTACAAPPTLSANDGRLQVVTTTGLIADLVRNVGGEDVNVVSLVPDGADPHSYEPSLRRARDVVYADAAFSNYLLLEEHSVIKVLDANLPDDAINVSLAEDAVKYAAEIIPLVEKVNLDTIWLGLRVHGRGEQYGATRASDVLLSATAMTGPGRVVGYITGSFGDPEVYFDSGDGFDAADGYRDDTAVLPADAHTHMSWSFSEPGVYTVDFAARLQVDSGAKSMPIGATTVTFAVGVPPEDAGDGRALDRGHADVTVDLDGGDLDLRYDAEGGGEHSQEELDPAEVVVDVPAKALVEIPGDDRLGFLGRPGTPVYQLPQAVLGKHIHGEIDPHLWQDVGNVMAYAELIRDTLIDADPERALAYRERADAYLAELEQLDAYVRDTIAEVPERRRYLVTTHDAFGYLAHAYGLQVAGFVTPNPATEPSLADRRKLVGTIRTLGVPAVFLEPNLRARSSVLTQVADEEGIDVCAIYGDAFDDRVTDYVQMMRFNAEEIRSCLS